MLADYEKLQRGVTVLSFARSSIEDICKKIEQAINEAKRQNKSPKFNKCCNKVEESVRKMRKTTVELVRIGQTLQAISEVLLKFEV